LRTLLLLLLLLLLFLFPVRLFGRLLGAHSVVVVTGGFELGFGMMQWRCGVYGCNGVENYWYVGIYNTDENRGRQ